MKSTLYQDSNIVVFEDHILLKGYYFLKFGQKVIRFSEIKSFEEVRLIHFNGMSRHEHIWLKLRWPHDWKCRTRTETLFVKLKGKRIGIGIAAERPRELALLFHKKMHLTSASGSEAILSPVLQN